MNLDEIRKKFAGLEKDIQCAFCLNPNAANQKPIQGKTMADGKQATAFLCDDHKDQEPKYAHQITDSGKVIMVDVNDLQGTQPSTGVQRPTMLEDQNQDTDAKAKKIASDIK